jgi:hypothetical protein
MPRELLLKRLARRLEEHLAMTEEAALWAVDSWALALGVVTDAEVRERERKSREPIAPPAATRSAPEETVEVKRPPDTADARAHTPPPPSQQRRPPPPAAPPPATPPRPTTARQRPPQTASTPGVGGPQVFRPRPSAGPLTTAQPSAHPGTSPPQDPATRPAPKRRGGRWRGCLIGCLLLVILTAALFLGVPYVVSLLREEQLQRSTDQTPAVSQ